MDARDGLLMEHGPGLGFPFSSRVKTSRFPEMRELRVQAKGDPLGMLYPFDARRVAILLIAGDKTGKDRWYEKNVPLADKLFERHGYDQTRRAKEETRWLGISRNYERAYPQRPVRPARPSAVG